MIATSMLHPLHATLRCDEVSIIETRNRAAYIVITLP